MRHEAAIRRIESFGKRFGPSRSHLYLAYHAAFPLALTPDLLYRIWANFQRDVDRKLLNIPWIAVADLLLSNLCDDVGHELYEMDVAVRNELLKQLKEDSRFGEKRINELSNFLLAYVRKDLNSSESDRRDFAQSQRWTALAYKDSEQAARELALAFNQAYNQDRSELVRLATLTETLAQPLQECDKLLIYARAMGHYARKRLEDAKNQVSSLSRKGQLVSISGVILPIPLELITNAEVEKELPTLEPLPDIKYHLGGTLPQDDPSYIKRQADDELYDALKAGRYCIMSAPRQMGQTSLIVQVMNRLKSEGFACAYIDLSGSGFNITKEQWYAGLIQELIRYFPNLEENFDLQKWWENQEKLSANQRFIAFIETVLLKQINENITIIIDEFDCILFTRDYSIIGDFPYLLKSFYNKRVIDKDYSRVNFVFSGVYLIHNQTLSPIANIAQEIELKGFTYEEALPLAGGLAEKTDNPQELLKYILEWTGGQPFLTQKLCSLVKESKQSIPNGTEKDWLDNLVRTQIIENWEFHDGLEHFRYIRDVILYKQKPEVLNLYESILQGEGDFDSSNEALQTLMSRGLVIRHDGKLRVANPIYADVFNLQWVKLNLAKLAKDFYVERPPVELNCYKAILKPGALIRIKGAHQMGKTLLLKKIGVYAEEQGYKTAFINFQLPNNSVFNDHTNFLKWFSYDVTKSLSLSNKLDEYWDDSMDLHSNCTDYFEDYILNQIETPIVLCLDELGRIFDYPEIAQSFLMLLRYWHQKHYEMNKRSIHWKKLRLVLSLSTEMDILQPMPISHSPFNVGFSIELREFSLAEVQELVQRYGLNLTVFQIEQLISMVGGHPYLIQIAVKSITEQNLTLDRLLEQASTEQGVYSSHLREKFFTLHQNPDLLAAFKEVISQEEPIKLESIVEYKLDAVGLVKFVGNKVIARNNLYRLYFLDKLSDL